MDPCIPHLVTNTMLGLWHDMYGASKGPCQILEAVDTIELNDFIRELNT
jgi:hypothetical protein